MSQHVMMPMREDRDNFSTHPTVDMVWFWRRPLVLSQRSRHHVLVLSPWRRILYRSYETFWTTKKMKLTIHLGRKQGAFSFSQTERPKQTSWWPVAQIAMAAGSLAILSIKHKCGKKLEVNKEQYYLIPHLNTNIIIIERLLHQLPSTLTEDSLKDIMLGPTVNGNGFLVTTMWRPFSRPPVSTPIETSSFPEIPGADSASPAKRQKTSHCSD